MACSGSGLWVCRCVSIQSEARSIPVWQIAALRFSARRPRLGVGGIGERVSLSRLDEGAGLEYAFPDEESDAEDYGAGHSGNALDAVDFAPI